MPEPETNRNEQLWRIAAGALAVVALIVALVRGYGMLTQETADTAASVPYGSGDIVRVIFPAGIAVLFGYVAFWPRRRRRNR